MSALVSILGACGPCLDNIRQLFCQLTCSPDQDQFLEVLQEVNIATNTEVMIPNWLEGMEPEDRIFPLIQTCSDPLTGINGPCPASASGVTQMRVVIDEYVASLTFASCSNVQYQSVRALDLVGNGAASWQQLLQFMGTPWIMGSPLNLLFVAASNASSIHPEVYACYAPAAPWLSACSIEDCPIPLVADQQLYAGWNEYGRNYSMNSSTVVASDYQTGLYSYLLHLNDSSLISENNLVILLVAMYCVIVFICCIIGLIVCIVRRARRNRNRSRHHIPDDSPPVSRRNSYDAPSRCWRGFTAFYQTGLTKFFGRLFYRLGGLCARRPITVLLIGFLPVAILTAGVYRLQVETRPIELWVSKSSLARQQKDFYDANFDPFYRVSQIFIKSSDGSVPVVSESTLEALFTLYDSISSINVTGPNQTTLDFEALCFRPGSEFGCVVQAPIQYWQLNRTRFESSGLASLRQCVKTPGVLDCLSSYKGPLQPQFVFGGFNSSEPDLEVRYLNTSTMLVMTFLLRNNIDDSLNVPAVAFEREFIRTIQSFQSEMPQLHFIYSTESAIEDELTRESTSDIPTILISYAVMFVYAAVALGHYRDWRSVCLDSKVTLGLCGLLIVVFSVSSAVGFFSWIGVKATLIIAEVVPFLVLAVGVDNIFIMVKTYQRLETEASVVDDGAEGSEEFGKPESRRQVIEERVARTMEKVGPSIVLSSLTETIIFALGSTVSSMPAIQIFSLFAALAVLINFLLQVTCFVCCLALDARRVASSRADCVPCMRVRSSDKPAQGDLIQRLIRNYYSPFLLHPITKVVVFFGSLGFLFACVYFATCIQYGLDQKQAIPSDSFLVDYFETMETDYAVGPPVYFVQSTQLNYSQPSVQNAFCRANNGLCYPNSLPAMLNEAQFRYSNVSYLSYVFSTWIDDYTSFVNPLSECCFYNPNTFEFCYSRNDAPECVPCQTNRSLTAIPPSDFFRFLDFFLNFQPDPTQTRSRCANPGGVLHGHSVSFNNATQTVTSSLIMAFHTPLRGQADYIASYRTARATAEFFNTQYADQGVSVFPYSVFYVFFEQYLDIAQQTVLGVGISMGVVFLMSFIILGDALTSFLVTTTTLMIVVDLAGCMYLWGISLNAISLVNLLMAAGISVEFCAHVGRAFSVNRGRRNDRVAQGP